MTAITRGRPRSTAADEAIRAAVVDLLGEVGYDEMTMAGVASAAGVSTATLYRRWRSKEDLVVGVLVHAGDEQSVPDTGSLAGDCRAVLRRMVATTNDALAGKRMAGFITAMSRHPGLAEAIRHSLIAPRRVALKAMFERARERGEVAADIDDDSAIDLLFGPVYYRLLITGQAFTRRTADDVVDLVVRAVAPQAPPTAPPSASGATR